MKIITLRFLAGLTFGASLSAAAVSASATNPPTTTDKQPCLKGLSANLTAQPLLNEISHLKQEDFFTRYMTPAEKSATALRPEDRSYLPKVLAASKEASFAELIINSPAKEHPSILRAALHLMVRDKKLTLAEVVTLIDFWQGYVDYSPRQFQPMRTKRMLDANGHLSETGQKILLKINQNILGLKVTASQLEAELRKRPASEHQLMVVEIEKGDLGSTTPYDHWLSTAEKGLMGGFIEDLPPRKGPVRRFYIPAFGITEAVFRCAFQEPNFRNVPVLGFADYSDMFEIQAWGGRIVGYQFPDVRVMNIVHDQPASYRGVTEHDLGHNQNVANAHYNYRRLYAEALLGLAAELKKYQPGETAVIERNVKGQTVQLHVKKSSDERQGLNWNLAFFVSETASGKRLLYDDSYSFRGSLLQTADLSKFVTGPPYRIEINTLQQSDQAISFDDSDGTAFIWLEVALHHAYYKTLGISAEEMINVIEPFVKNPAFIALLRKAVSAE